MVGLDDLSGGFADNLHPDIPLYVRDILTVDLDDLFALYQVSHVWHLAAYAAEGLSHWVREHNVRSNYQTAARLTTAAVKHGVEGFYFTSSMAVYGGQDPPFTEAMTPRPEDPYGVAKYAAELDLHAASRLFGLPVTVFRPHNVYGPGQNIGDPYRNVVGKFMRQALEGEPITIFGDGLQTRAFSYITDITGPMVRAHQEKHYGHTFNIGGETPVTILDLAARVSALFDGVPIVHLEERFEVKHAWCDHRNARQLLGFRPHVSFDVGLERMAGWVRKVGVRRSETPTFEMTRNLPEFWRETSPLPAV